MSGEPKVSVLVPARDTAPWLGTCLESLVRQTHQNIDVVVLDDGSRDGTFWVADAFSKRDPRVRVVRGKRSGGVAAARNKLLDLIPPDAEFACWQDSDDLCNVRRVEMQVAEMARTGAPLCYTGEEFVHALGPGDWRRDPAPGTAIPGIMCCASHMWRAGLALPRFVDGITMGGEDVIWLYEMEVRHGRAVGVDARLYYRRVYRSGRVGVQRTKKSPAVTRSARRKALALVRVMKTEDVSQHQAHSFYRHRALIHLKVLARSFPSMAVAATARRARRVVNAIRVARPAGPARRPMQPAKVTPPDIPRPAAGRRPDQPGRPAGPFRKSIRGEPRGRARKRAGAPMARQPARYTPTPAMAASAGAPKARQPRKRCAKEPARAQPLPWHVRPGLPGARRR